MNPILVPRESSATSASDHAVSADDVLDLSRIHEPGCNLAVWRRPPRPDIEAAALRVAAVVDSEWRAGACLGVDAEPAMELLPLRVREAEPQASQLLLKDVAWLVRVFRAVHPRAHVEAELAMLLAPQCPRFHTDRVGIRLLHTWCGPGTEWIANADVDRRLLARRDRGVAPPVVRADFVTRTVPPFAVALLRGDASRGNAGNGIVHRSPDPRGSPRLLLRLDDGMRHRGRGAKASASR